MTFVGMERELALRLFFRDVDIYKYTFIQEYHVAKEAFSIHTCFPHHREFFKI